MARARLLPDALLSSREFSALPDDSALAFLMLLPHWDRDGLLDGDAAWELPKLMHYRNDLSKRLVAYIENWENVGMVLSYLAGGRKILYWRRFRVYNANIVTGREAPSRYPAPPGYSRHESGLIPDNENEIQELIYQLDPRSGYRLALERALRLKVHGLDDSYDLSNLPNSVSYHDDSLSNHDNSRALTERSRALSVDHQDQDQDVDVDQINQARPLLVKVTGGLGGAYGFESLGTLDRITLERLALEAGAVIGLLGEWSNYLDYLTSLNHSDLINLVLWIAHYADLPNEAKEKIASQTAIIRAHLNRSERATLRGSARQWLSDLLMRMDRGVPHVNE